MNDIFEQLLAAMAKGEATVLVTVVKSLGSSPRNIGAHMLVGANGRIAGTIGGGKVELVSEEMGKDLLKEKHDQLKDFNLVPKDNVDFGICGGQVEVLYHYIPADSAPIKAIAEAIADALKNHQASWLVTGIRDQKATVTFYSEASGFIGDPVDKAHFSESITTWKDGETYFLSDPISTDGKVYIFGGGHVGEALAKLLESVDFYTVIFDDRPDRLTDTYFPTAHECILGDYDHINEQVVINPNDYTIVMTQGHKADLNLQVQLLQTPAHYIGVIGSAHKIVAQNKMLKDQGITDTQLSRLVKPIGIPIGGDTPGEIAISIAAQLVQDRFERLNQ